MSINTLDIRESTLAKLIGTSDAAELMAELEAYDAQCKANKTTAQEAATELGILPIHPLASPFERKHRARQEQANGFLLFLDEEGKVFKQPTQEDITEGSKLSVPFTTPDADTIERLYQECRDERAQLLLEAEDDEG